MEKIILYISSEKKYAKKGANDNGNNKIITKLLLVSVSLLEKYLNINEWRWLASGENGLLFSTYFFLINENSNSVDG